MNLDRNNRRKLILVFLAIAITLMACAQTKKATAGKLPVPVIFETDMGNDVDDALALDMLYKYQDSGLIKLILISTNKNSPYSARYIDILNTWYGYPDIAVGEVKNGANSQGDSRDYAQAVCEYTPAFRHTKDTFLESVALYRQVLASQPDQAVIIISTGFSTNLARLLDSKGDTYSPLDGKDLVAKKVKLLSMMAGNFEGDTMIEYNVLRDVPAAKEVFEHFPTKVVTSPFELGNQILYPASSIEKDFNWTAAHPVVIAYKSYLPMPYDRPTWDLTAVLYAIEGEQPYFTISKPGIIRVDGKGYTSFTANPAGNRQYLEVTPEQAATIKNHFIKLITAKPKQLQE
ncbi:nucleoside hydrolase [Ilyomonas limi]|uniref:Nucleoside hydrolase n=1 Tax=Ilyomonas limi TaxID=2575867 RepID=A0A4U3KYM9_9BACT|nr:nucleoside hydrolase [Ilyomonas limi]TKK66989.1 nucleoside hydrolase [Ilyomonas limi]